MLTSELQLWKERFGEHLKLRGVSPRTVATYTGELKPFFAFLDEFGVENLARLSREHLEEYRTRLFYSKHRGRSLSLSTQSVRLQALKRFARFLAHERYHLLDVGLAVDLPARRRRLPRVILTERETLRLLEAPDTATTLGLRDRALLEVLYATGLRNAEAGELLLEHVDFARHLVHVACGKGGKARMVPLGEEAQVWLEEYLAHGRPRLARDPAEQRIFLSMRGRFLHRSELAQMVTRWAKRAGLSKHVTAHTLRHSCATHMLRRGAGLRQLQILLGHSSPDTTQLYTQVELSDLRKVLQRCHPRERPR